MDTFLKEGPKKSPFLSLLTRLKRVLGQDNLFPVNINQVSLGAGLKSLQRPLRFMVVKGKRF